MLHSLSELILVLFVFQSSSNDFDAKKVNLYYLESVIKHILNDGFVSEGPVLIVLSPVTQKRHPRFLYNEDFLQTLHWLPEITVEIIYTWSLWSVSIINPKELEFEIVASVVRNKGYIIFVNPETEDCENELIDSLNTLQSKPSWNPRSKFVILAFGEPYEPPELFSETVLSTLNSYDNAIESVLIIVCERCGESVSMIKDDHEKNLYTPPNGTSMIAYTVFPYLEGRCKNQVPSLIGIWNLDKFNKSYFIADKVFSSKIPKNFMGCTLTLSPVGPAPYLIKENYTRGNTTENFAVSGTGVELIILFASERNFTVEFLEPTTLMEIDRLLDRLALLQSGGADIQVGVVPVVYPLTAIVDLSTPLFYDTLEYVVPCPRPLDKIRRILTLFTVSSWTSIIIVFVLVSTLLWTMAKLSACKETFTGFRKLAQCFSAAWATLLGISVPELPTHWEMRCFFIIYIWYCFSINTIFQAFFTTYLVEPGYEQPIETLEDVARLGLKFGSFEALDFAMELEGFSLFNGFKRVAFTNVTECARTAIYNRDTFSVFLSQFIKYVASVDGIQDEKTAVCFLEKSLGTLSLGVALPKGSPLLRILNSHLRHCMEAGLLETYWSKLIHHVNLRADPIREDGEFVVFNLTHLEPVFVFLIFGYILSLSFFLCEILIKRYVTEYISIDAFQENV